MKFTDAVQMLLALGQETRLTVFRLIVRRGDTGIYPSQIAEDLGLAPATLSFHLKELQRARLVSVERQSRKLLYRPRARSVDQLMEFLLSNCCGGKSCTSNRTMQSRAT
mgnify:CR=1 FL=1